MDNIKEFGNYKQFLKYINKEKGAFINEGSEGEIYHSKDGQIIKIMQDLLGNGYKEYNKDMLLESNLKLDSYIFPNEMYLLDGKILGYKEKYFNGDLFNIYPKKDINIDNLIKAREKFIEDTKILTDFGYKLFELPRNIMFNNKRLVAIDTLDYIKKEITLKENIEILDYALLTELHDIYKELDNSKPFDEEIEKIYTKKRS